MVFQLFLQGRTLVGCHLVGRNLEAEKKHPTKESKSLSDLEPAKLPILLSELSLIRRSMLRFEASLRFEVSLRREASSSFSAFLSLDHFYHKEKIKEQTYLSFSCPHV